MQDRPVRVIAIDDHPVMLTGIHHTLLASGEPVECVRVIESVSHLDGEDADVALLDLRLRDGSCPRANIRALLEHGLKVLVYTDGVDLHLMSDAVMAGALGIVLKHQPPETLVEAIATVDQGRTFLSPELEEVLHRSTAQRPQLSAKEVEVLQLLRQGLITKQAARKMNVSESTIKEYIKRIRAKYTALGRSASTRVELMQRAIEDGYIDPHDGIPEA